MSIKLFMDCGAPSLYNKLGRMQTEGGGSALMGAHMRHRGRDSTDYIKTPEYLKYRDDYIQFIKDHAHLLEAYPNLDVINNAELTYKNQKILEEAGIHPLPVWHFGSDEKWLELYIDEGYPYICMGGMVPNSKSVLRPALDSLWRRVLTDDTGMPKVKVHGFAMTSFDLMYRYPWFSVDSKSWIDIAKFGGILVPPLKNGKRDYLNPNKIHLTPRSIGAHADRHHIRTCSHGIRAGTFRYLKEIGIPMGRSRFKSVPPKYELKAREQWADGEQTKVEITIDPGVCNTHNLRLDVNLQCYRKIEEIIPAWPWKLPHRIKKGKQGLFV